MLPLIRTKTFCRRVLERKHQITLMGDPNPKREKMDNSNEQSSSTSPKDSKIQPCLIDTRSQLFEDIKNKPSFVDHTRFIKDFLSEEDLRRLAIFGPRRFGKSTHLDMLRRFLEIDIDKTTGEISSSVNGPAKKRKNYKLFEKTFIIDHKSNKDLVEAHLGRHPVIYLDLKTSDVDSFETAEKHCREVVHRAYLDHSYLRTSTKLVPMSERRNTSSQNVCREWCDDETFKTQDLSGSLENLTKYLYNHCNETKIYILVDDFDSIHASAIRSISGNPHYPGKLRDICIVVTGLLETVAKGEFSNTHVAGVLFTGASYEYGLGPSSQFNNFIKLKFLDASNTTSRNENAEFRGFERFF